MLILSECLTRHGVRPRGILHAGAHLAEEMDEYLSFGPDLIVWIEGDPDLARGIQQAIAARGHRPTRQLVISALITDRDGEPVDFYRFSNEGASSSIFRATPLLRETWPELRETGDVLRLPSSRLDTALRAHGIAPDMIDVMVLDLQGAELLALAGAGTFLEAAWFIEVEVSEAEFYAGGAQAANLVAFLSAQGFEPITPLQRHGDTIFRSVRPRLSHGEAAALRAEIAAIRSSWSWRLTAPLRWLASGGKGPVALTPRYAEPASRSTDTSAPTPPAASG